MEAIMRKVAKIAITLVSTLMCLTSAYSGIPNNDDPTTFLGPTLRGGYTTPLSDMTALSVSGEVAPKNFRVGGTLAWRLAENQRLKVSAEYLWQDITYSFFSGNTDQWVNQGAIGAAYVYSLMGYSYNPELGISGYLSHAPNESLSTVTGTYVNNLGVVTGFTDVRRIAGSNAGGISPGITVQPWRGGKAGLELNYDAVNYDTNYGTNRDAHGFGGTAKLSQMLTDHINLGVSAAVRQPFNNYQAHLAWSDVPYYGRWTVGLNGAYTSGKNTLPSTWNAGLSADYFMDPSCGTLSSQRAAGTKFMDLKGEAPAPVRDNFLEWTADPAVYMPQVLAIPDELLTTGCPFGVPTFVGTIPLQSTSSGLVTVTLNSATFFTGSNLTYSIVTSATPAPGNTLTFNTATGVLTATGPATQIITATITATNPCGSATSNTFSIVY